MHAALFAVRLAALCAAFAFVGCSQRTELVTAAPEDGKCGWAKDVCLLGTPADTGDTTSPYEWRCVGKNGGATDHCSARISPVAFDDGEVFSGQHDLAERLKAAGSLRGKLTIADDPTPGTHGEGMKRTALEEMGVPEENLAFAGLIGGGRFLTDPRWRELREDTLVVGLPNAWAEGINSWEPGRIARHDILFVAAAGNRSSSGNRRDLWTRDHPNWRERPGDYENAMAAFGTGKVILAKYALLLPSGDIQPYNETVRCDDAKDFCYSILTRNNAGGSSSASVRLAALVFYLYQLWDSPQEVIGVLNACAEDIGEPGIDEEFGRGVPSVACEMVHSREAGAVRESLNAFVSPIRSQMMMTSPTATPRSASPVVAGLTTEAPALFVPFFSINGYTMETIAGHLGSRLSLKGTDFFVSGGADYAPLGIRSSLVNAVRTPFMEFGVRRPLFRHNGHRMFLLSTYGHATRSSMAAHAGYIGAHYERRFGAGTLALHAGYQHIQGAVAIPGYREAGTEPVAFAEGNPEAWLSFRWSP